MRQDSSKVGIIVAAIVVSVLLVCGVSLGVGYKVLKERSASRAADKKSVADLAGAMSKAGSGEKLDDMQFPDTPIGHMNRIVYDLMRKNQDVAKKFKTSLAEIGWDQIGQIEGLEKPAKVEENLARIAKVKIITNEFADTFDRNLKEATAALQAESEKSRDAANYFGGFQEAMAKPDNALALTHKTIEILRENHKSLEGQYQLLKKWLGHYKTDTGQILFDEKVGDAELKKFNDYATKTQSTMQELQDLDAKQRQKVADSARGLSGLGRD